MSNAALLSLAEPLGLDEETLELLRLLPMIYVAWSDGEVQAEEMNVILSGAESIGLSSAKSLTTLEGWLAERPGDEFFREGLKVLGYLVASLSDEEATQAAEDVMALSRAVARAAGGLLGHTVRTDHNEDIALREIWLRLDLANRPGTRQALQKILSSRQG